jgi:hypothetical protein
MSDSRLDDPSALGWFADLLDRLWAVAADELVQAAQEAAAGLRATAAPLDEQRAEILLAVAFQNAGNGDAALRHALCGLSLSEQHKATQTAFDHAMALATAAKAQNVAGNGGEAFRLILLALAEADKLNADERALFDKLFGEP